MLLTQIMHNSQRNSALNQKYILSLNGHFLFAFFHSFCGVIPKSTLAAMCKLYAIIMVVWCHLTCTNAATMKPKLLRYKQRAWPTNMYGNR